MDVTFPEWGNHLTSLAHDVVVRWPFVSVSVDRNERMSVEIKEVMSGAVDLRTAGGDARCMVPRIDVSGSGGLPQDLSLAQSKINDMQTVLGVLHYCNAQCVGIRVFAEGECPCAQCSGRGTMYRSKTPCDACDGKGTR